MVIICILAIFWAVGLLGVLGFFVFDWYLSPESIPGKLVIACVGVPLWAVLGLGPMGIIIHESGPELATLLKSDWQCTAAHEETTTTMIVVGKVMVPTTSTSSICDQYGKK